MGRHGRRVNGTGHGAADNDLTLAHGVNFTSLENLRAILTIIMVSQPCRSTGCHSRGQNSAERSPLYAGTGASDGWYQYATGGVILSTASLFLSVISSTIMGIFCVCRWQIGRAYVR